MARRASVMPRISSSGEVSDLHTQDLVREKGEGRRVPAAGRAISFGPPGRADGVMGRWRGD